MEGVSEVRWRWLHDGGVHRRSGSVLSLSVLCMAVFVPAVVSLEHILSGEHL